MQNVHVSVSFETIPQAILQSLLFLNFIDGRELLDVSGQTILLSIGSACLSMFTKLIKLKMESLTVKEMFVQYALNSINARADWVPFRHIIEAYVASDDSVRRYCDDDGQSQRAMSYYQELLDVKTPKEEIVRMMLEDGVRAAIVDEFRRTSTLHQNADLVLNYNLKFPIVGVTSLSAWWKRRNDYKPLTVSKTHKLKRERFGRVPFDFSSVTINTLILAIKPISETRKRDLVIKFGGSLRLIDVRSIIRLMQECHARHIRLPDIDQIQWNLAFSNGESDPRFFSNTFDEENKSLLISLYLTGYHQRDYHILRS